MTINCVWEHNGRDTLLYAVDFVGAYTRGETLEAAVRKMQAEICSYLKWCGKKAVTSMDIAIIEEKVSELAICDADSDVLFESEKAPLTAEEYKKLKALALKSAQDFLALYDSVPDIRSPQLCGIKDWCENQCRFVVLLYKTTCFDGELHSSSEGRVWWEDIANLPNLKLSLDMRDMLRVFIEENLSEFFYYQESSAWKYVLK